MSAREPAAGASAAQGCARNGTASKPHLRPAACATLALGPAPAPCPHHAAMLAARHRQPKVADAPAGRRGGAAQRQVNVVRLDVLHLCVLWWVDEQRPQAVRVRAGAALRCTCTARHCAPREPPAARPPAPQRTRCSTPCECRKARPCAAWQATAHSCSSGMHWPLEQACATVDSGEGRALGRSSCGCHLHGPTGQLSRSPGLHTLPHAPAAPAGPGCRPRNSPSEVVGGWVGGGQRGPE